MESLELMTITLMMFRLANITQMNWFLIWLPFIISMIIRFFKFGYNSYEKQTMNEALSDLFNDLEFDDEEE